MMFEKSFSVHGWGSGPFRSHEALTVQLKSPPINQTSLQIQCLQEFSQFGKKGDPLVIFAWSEHIENCELDLIDREGHRGKVSINNTHKFKAGRMEMFP